jgi:hypothetical protein
MPSIALAEPCVRTRYSPTLMVHASYLTAVATVEKGKDPGSA